MSWSDWSFPEYPHLRESNPEPLSRSQRQWYWQMCLEHFLAGCLLSIWWIGMFAIIWSAIP